jgi:DNA-binding response OmpR family regulator
MAAFNRWKFLMVIPRSPPMAPDRPRILVIEDDLLIALMIEDMVREAGYRVSGVAHTIAVARHEIAKRNFDAVLFDLDIGRRSHPEIADFLLDTGVPFAFVTGYDYLVEPRHQTVPVLEKPFTPVQLRALLEKLVGSRSPTGESLGPHKHVDAGLYFVLGSRYKGCVFRKPKRKRSDGEVRPGSRAN